MPVYIYRIVVRYGEYKCGNGAECLDYFVTDFEIRSDAYEDVELLKKHSNTISYAFDNHTTQDYQIMLQRKEIKGTNGYQDINADWRDFKENHEW